MSDYTKTTDFAAKDSLPGGDPGKIIKGSEFETEFDNIVTAIATKYDSAEVELAAIAGLTSAANKVPMFSGSGTATLLDFKDEDTMVSDSATAVPSQQSVKAYVDSNVGSSGTWTPSVTAVSGCTVAASGSGAYSRVGNIVTFSAKITVALDVANTVGLSRLTLPVASNFTASTDASGTATEIISVTIFSGVVYADTTNDQLTVGINGNSTAQGSVYISGMYQVK